MDKKVLSNIALFITALIWGLSFVAQKAGMDYVGPFSFNFARSILGGVSLIPFIFVAKLLKEDNRSLKIKHFQHITLIKAGLSCGAALFTAMSIQQYSMLQASAGKAGFISALYIIFVPIILKFFGTKLSLNTKISVGIALIGLYLLCFSTTNGIRIDFYDILLLIAAFFYGVHIIVVNYFSRKVDAAKISCLQFFIVGILSIPLMLLFETPNLQSFIDCKIPILYAGILTCGVAYTLQIFGQKYSTPTIASLILCLESVFAVIGGSIILHESMNIKEICGCLFMISAVIISQINLKNIKKVPLELSQQEVKKTADSDR
uniref:Permease n=1 Tax=uncultured Candidatus Melainabacteria bacterium TaxID=2682970 RepID=A0A650EJ14_9BACT|nr:permease [uncultured Candidatus Melainabacteria bacterium]